MPVIAAHRYLKSCIQDLHIDVGLLGRKVEIFVHFKSRGTKNSVLDSLHELSTVMPTVPPWCRSDMEI